MTFIAASNKEQNASASTIRVLIVDDHELVRHGLRSFLGVFADLEIVGEARNGREAVQKCEDLRPHVIIMDLMMPEMNGIEATETIRKRFPEIAIIALSSSSDPASVTAAMQAGATSYLLKNIGVGQLADAVRAAMQGHSTLAPEAAGALIRAATRPPGPQFYLTGRERDILALLVQGLNNPDIAERLSVSRSTVKYHISAILSKLEVSNRSEAIAMAIRENLV